MTRTHGRDLIVHALSALVLTLGITITAAAPAIADIDTTRQTASDGSGVISMTAEHVSNDRYADLIKVTYTVDTTDIEPTSEEGYLYISLQFSKMRYHTYDDPSLDPTIKVDGGDATSDYNNVPGLLYIQVSGGLGVYTHRESGIGHRLEITCYGLGLNSNAGGSGDGVSNLRPSRDPITLTVWTNYRGGSYDHEYQCSIDRVFPSHFETRWDDANDIAGLRPTTTEYANDVKLYVGCEPYTGTGSQLMVEENADQPSYLIGPSKGDFPTLLVPTGTQLTYAQSDIPHYTASTTTLDAMHYDPNNPSKLDTITNSLSTQHVTEGSLTVTLKDSSTGDALPGGTYELRDAGGAAVATFTTGSDGTFTIDPADAALASALPAAGESADLTLVETAAPTGYQLDSSAHRVRVSRTDTTSLAAADDTDTYVRTSTYVFEVDGTAAEAISFTNAKALAQAKPASNPTQAKAAVVPKTGDPTPIVFVCILASLGCAALVVARKIASTNRK